MLGRYEFARKEPVRQWQRQPPLDPGGCDVLAAWQPLRRFSGPWLILLANWSGWWETAGFLVSGRSILPRSQPSDRHREFATRVSVGSKPRTSTEPAFRGT